MRPNTRPSKPLTFQEIATATRKHFFEENNPQCRDEADNCVYGLTGCAVGHMFTQEDADKVDSVGLMSVIPLSQRFPEIYSVYFTQDQLAFLQSLQNWHDNDSRFGNREQFEDIVSMYCKEVPCS